MASSRIHGCAPAGLRKLSAVAPAQVEAAAISNAAWLEDVVMHLLCVLALDRFADYVSDQVGALGVFRMLRTVLSRVQCRGHGGAALLLVRAACGSILAP
jgi:hypothetical protein